MRNFLEGPALSIGPSQKVQCEVIYFPYAVRKSKELFKNCSIDGTNREAFLF